MPWQADPYTSTPRWAVGASTPLESIARSNAARDLHRGAYTPPMSSDDTRQRQRKASFAAPEGYMRAGIPASTMLSTETAGSVAPDIVQQLEDLLSIAKAEKARGELTDSSLSSWLLRQSVSMNRLPREALGTSGTGATPGSSHDHSMLRTAGSIPRRSELGMVTKGALKASEHPSSYPARASSPGSAKVVHDQRPSAVDHEGNKDLQGMAMWRDGRSGEPPRGGPGRLLETMPWQGNHTSSRSPYRARLNVFNSPYALRTPQRSFDRNGYRNWQETPIGNEERFLSFRSPATAYLGAGSSYTSRSYPSDRFPRFAGGAAGRVYASSSSDESTERSDREDYESEHSSEEPEAGSVIEGEEQESYQSGDDDRSSDDQGSSISQYSYEDDRDDHEGDTEYKQSIVSEHSVEAPQSDRVTSYSQDGEIGIDQAEQEENEQSAYSDDSQYHSDYELYDADDDPQDHADEVDGDRQSDLAQDDYDYTEDPPEDIPDEGYEEFEDNASQGESEGTFGSDGYSEYSQ
ncbi:hypothetical protein PENSPDRAFT_695552 [Peniophora sp. CONT]|nr:hypothetical protein PENSPDRAFT_695552 [Peniophora sp. CONT]